MAVLNRKFGLPFGSRVSAGRWCQRERERERENYRPSDNGWMKGEKAANWNSIGWCSARWQWSIALILNDTLLNKDCSMPRISFSRTEAQLLKPIGESQAGPSNARGLFMEQCTWPVNRLIQGILMLFFSREPAPDATGPPLGDERSLSDRSIS